MTTVPSNLVPTKITDLPVAPAPTPTATMVCVIGGVTYQIPFIDLQSTISVPASRTISAGSGLVGGGDLSQDRTLSIAPAGVTTDKIAPTGVVAGSYGSGSAIPVIEVNAEGQVTAISTTGVVVTGFALDTIEILAGDGLVGGGNLQANRTLSVDYGLSNPLPLGVPSPGSAKTLSRSDHIHPAVDLADATEVTGLLPLTNGGTGEQVLNLVSGAVWYTDGTHGFLQTTQGNSGQVLVSGGSGAPSWGNVLIVTDQPANYVCAGPVAGGPGPTSFRALVDADIPSILTGKTLNTASITNSSIDSTTIGGTTAAAVTGTTITANTQFSGPGTGLTGTAAGLSIGGNSATASLASASTNLAGGLANQLPYQTGAGATSFIAAPTVANTYLEWSGSAFQWSVNPLGTVTSVGLSLPSEFTVSNSPVTTSGTLTGAWAAQTANYVFAGPSSGSAAAPGFRTLVNADIPTTLDGKTITNATVTGSTINSTSIGASAASTGVFTQVDVDNVRIDGNTLSSTNTDGNINIDPNGTGAVNIPAPVTNPTYIQMGSGSGTTLAAGRMWYDEITGSLNFGMGGGNIAQQVGEEIFVYGKASATITEGQVIAKTGTVGASGVITFAPAPLGTSNPDLIIGIATENIASGSFGRVTQFGVVRGIDTSMFADGDALYYDPTAVGGWTKTKPSAPNMKLEVATVITAGPGGSGSVQVKLGSSSILGGTDSNVQLASPPANDSLLQYYTAGGYWRDVLASNIIVGTATNLANGVAGAVPYQSAAGVTGFSSAGNAGEFLVSGGTGSPTWTATISGGTYA